MTNRLPAVFIGHGSPMNALGGNRFTDAWSAFGARFRPRAVLMISAHWYTRGYPGDGLRPAANQPRFRQL